MVALLPASLVPVEAERAQLRYHLQHLVLAAVPRLERDGGASIDGELGRVRVARPDGAIVAGGGSLALSAPRAVLPSSRRACRSRR